MEKDPENCCPEAAAGPPPPGRAGRPREWDMDTALESAMRVFWRHGYEGATLTELTEAMGINRPSLYAAFGDKAGLFRKVVERYQKGPACYLVAALREESGFAVAAKLLNAAADLQTCPENPGGCLVSQTALVCGEADEAVRAELVKERESGETALRERLAELRESGQWRSDANPELWARFLTTMIQGMSVQASNGTSRAQLQGVIDVALSIFPR